MNTAGRAHEYQTELQTNIAKAAYAANVKASFDNLADTMLRAFCLREIQLQGTTDDAKRKQINDNYLAYLVSLVNTHVKTMYEHHQDDIDADATRWWLWKKICSVFENQDDRQRHTQAMQMGLLHLVSGFHKGLAEEKTWIGKNPLKFAVYSGLAGIAVGVLATFFIGSLLAMMWPVVAAAAAAGALVFGVTSYLYAKKAPYKRSFDERKTHQAFEASIDAGEEALKDRLLQATSLKPEDLDILAQYNYDTATGWIFNNYVAQGTPESWLRTFATHYAHSLFIENDVAPHIKILMQRAEKQTNWLVHAIRESASGPNAGHANEDLQNYIRETRLYILGAHGQQVQKRYELIEKAKEQVLAAIARVGNIVIPAELNDLFRDLQGNDDQLELAKTFCSSMVADVYNPLLEKANELISHIYTFGDPIFVGSQDYWEMLNIEGDFQYGISEKTIDALLVNTTTFLRKLSPSIERSSQQEPTYSEAYYLYRTMLMRQLAQLVHDKNCSVVCVAKIKQFIQNTLLVANEGVFGANLDQVIGDIYHHALEMPLDETANIGQGVTLKEYPNIKLNTILYFTSAMRIDLAYHPSIAPAVLLQRCIIAFCRASVEDSLVFGSTDQSVLSRFNFDSGRDLFINITKIIGNSQSLFSKLKAKPVTLDQWNNSSVNLQYAYQDLMTRQILFALKSVLISLSRFDDAQQKIDKIDELSAVYKALYQFLLHSGCFKNTSCKAVHIYLESLFNICNSADQKELLLQAKQHLKCFDMELIHENDIGVEAKHEDESFFSVQQNIMLNKIYAVEVENSAILIRYDRARDYQVPTEIGASAAEKGVFEQLYGFFSWLFSSNDRAEATVVNLPALPTDDPSIRTSPATLDSSLVSMGFFSNQPSPEERESPFQPDPAVVAAMIEAMQPAQ